MDRHPLPLDAWYVACATVELAAAPIGRRICDLPVVLFRNAAGSPIALHDRCPHRGVALSLGSVTEGRLACAYHGWRFGETGRCEHIPSLNAERRIPPSVGVERLPCLEQDGYVWVWRGDGAPATESPLPIPGFADRAWTQGALDLACEAILPIENNLDICHPTFTHPGLHPQWFAVQARGFREQAYELAPTATGLEVRSPGVRLAFDLPDRVTVDAGSAAPVFVIHHTPTTPGRCRQHWLASMPAADASAPHAVRWTDVEPEIFAQDRRVLESAQRTYESEGDAFERSVEADAPALMLRRLIAAAREGGELANSKPRRLLIRS